MIAHICDKCGQVYTKEWRLIIVKKDGYKIDLCPNCQEGLKEWLGIPEAVFETTNDTKMEEKG